LRNAPWLDRKSEKLSKLFCGKSLQSKDFIDEILNLDTNSLDEALKFEKLLADDNILIKQEPEELSMAEVRDRQKKDNHNMSEYSDVTTLHNDDKCAESE
jgi:hypothetical protein